MPNRPQATDGQLLREPYSTPDEAPGLNGLLAKLVALGHPENRALDGLFEKATDDRLHCDPGLTRTGRQREKSSAWGVRGQHTTHLVHQLHLIVMRRWQVGRSQHLQEGRLIPWFEAGVFRLEAERLNEFFGAVAGCPILGGIQVAIRQFDLELLEHLDSEDGEGHSCEGVCIRLADALNQTTG